MNNNSLDESPAKKRKLIEIDDDLLPQVEAFQSTERRDTLKNAANSLLARGLEWNREQDRKNQTA